MLDGPPGDQLGAQLALLGVLDRRLDRDAARRSPGRAGCAPRRGRRGRRRDRAPAGAGRRADRAPRGAGRRCRPRTPTRSGSSRIRRSVPAIVTKRPGATWTPTVSLITSSSTWASSNTTTSCSGRITPPLPTCSPYRWVLTTTTSAAPARRRACSAKHGSPSGQRSAPGHSSLPTLTIRHDGVGRRPVELGAVAGVGGGHPPGDAGDLGPRRSTSSPPARAGRRRRRAARAGAAGRRSCCGP